jgi:hypothetical protein
MVVFLPGNEGTLHLALTTTGCTIIAICMPILLRHHHDSLCIMLMTVHQFVIQLGVIIPKIATMRMITCIARSTVIPDYRGLIIQCETDVTIDVIRTTVVGTILVTNTRILVTDITLLHRRENRSFRILTILLEVFRPVHVALTRGV